MEIVTVINRSSKALEGTWDGKHYELLPGKKYAYPAVQAEAFKRQNPVMGSEDPRTLITDYLIGIVEYGDNCEPMEQSNSIEKWDRTKLSGVGPVDVVPGRTGLFSARDVHAGLDSDTSSFVKP